MVVVLGIGRKKCAGKLVGISKEILNDIPRLFNIFFQAIVESRATILNIVTTIFPENEGYHGCTFFATLAQSHAWLETTPELGTIEYEIETCGNETNPQKFVDHLSISLRSLL
ncbi:hypothetical protein A3F08_02875 [Candidatus Berkelbacteria bacterium RIFCSPHIGHO2_12_FULL_36_9]|uniref:Uncharacterized protein n=1 Tax=Candidatus Berkelbacteria bacterium RIFCSPHIGHO2_12_FULL_36_9 TaxID=1797469 RepID=A0A1F5EKA5_9BACT|nr:MAG: hypothetical protein A3F08_02875 [Candidatus Berkelbacteria bacterium RIFCSPHIGHO2_12_FULL_36_9]